MAIPELEALSVANNISANTSKAQYNKTKNQLQKSEIGIKKAQLLGSLPSSTDVAGDVMMGGANSMAQSPRNGMTGLVEGLLRAFGGSLKGKAADERRQQIMDSLDVLDYTMQGEEYLKNTQQQIAKQKNDMQYRLSQKQYEQAYSDGTLDQTLKATFQQIGIDPNNVQLSSDGLNVYIEKDGKITKAPVSDFFSPEDSQKFQFINSTQKANLAQSENKQVQGLAQENNMLKSRLDVLEEQYKQMGMNPAISKSLARGVVNEERIQQNEEAMKERGFSLQERGLGIQQQNANISQDYLDLEKEKREEEQKNKLPLTTEQIKYFTDQSDKLKGIEEEVNAYKELEKLLVKTDEKGNPILDKKGNKQLSNEALGEWFISRPNSLKNAKQVRFDQLQSDLTGAHFKKMGYRNETEYKKIRNVDSQYGAKENMKIIEDNLRILEKGLNKKKEIDSLLERSLSPLTQQNSQYGGQQAAQSGNTEAGTQSGGTITLYDPKSQATKTIPTSDYAKSKELAKKQGFGVIE